MHIPGGFWKNGLGDIDVIAHDGVLHAFYLCIPSHDRVGHLTSRDGILWEEQPFALHTGDPGDFDDDQIWTMGVFQNGQKFFMLYTGLSIRDRGKIQRVGLATSENLVSWQKHPANPVLTADPRYYEAQSDARHRVDWRDPYVFCDNGTLHGVISARTNTGPKNRRGAAGHFTSKDGIHWEVQPPLCVPGNCYDFETPALARINGRFYLSGICGKNAQAQGMVPSIVRVADAIDGPYRRIAHDALLPEQNQVFKPCNWNGQILYFHNLRGVADWPGGGNNPVTCLAPPKVADTTEEGELVLRPFREWKSVETGAPLEIASGSFGARGDSVVGQWEDSPKGLTNAGAAGYGVFLLHGEYSHGILEAEIEPGDGGSCGFILRSDCSADDATFISLSPALRKIELYSLQESYKTPCAGVTYRWRCRRVVQDWTCSGQWAGSMHLRVVLYGPYCEVSINDRVAISAVTLAKPGGRMGVFVEDARLTLKNLVFQPLKPSPCMESCL